MYKNMKLFMCFLISMYMLMLSSAFASQVTINTQVLNIRQNPTTNSSIIGKVNKNEKYNIIEEFNNWIKINKNNQEGWISKDYVIVEQNANNTAEQNNNVNTIIKEKVVTATKLNVRSNPSTTATIVSVISKNTVVNVLDTQNGWDKININNITGWVSNNYLANYTTTGKQENVVNSEKTLVITANVLNVRNNPTTNSAVIGSLKYNTTVIAVAQENGWYKIKYNNGYAYISSAYATSQNELASRGNYVRGDVDTASLLADTACKYIGYKYVYGGSSPSGFDCSGLVYYVYKNYVTNLPRGATSQSKIGEYVAKENLRKGDLVFFTENQGTNVTHVGIYLENGYFVHAANSNRGVVKDTINSGYYYKNYLFAKRIV